MFELRDIVTPQQVLREIEPGSFIYEQQNALSREDCDKIIENFEAHEEDQYVGVIGKGVERLKVKRSTDLYLLGQPHWQWADDLFFNSLNLASKELRAMHKTLDEEPLDDAGYQIQRTLPGEYYHWHKDTGFHSRKRLMVAIWYLNDVPSDHGGATQFQYQDISIQPEAGKLILFPPYWTHVHRGQKLLDGKKYIVCTWLVHAGANDND